MASPLLVVLIVFLTINSCFGESSDKLVGRERENFWLTATRLFAATTTGLIALDLQTLDATALTSTHTGAVAVNHNLKKVYWAENNRNSSIMRANFDGSAKEVIFPPKGDDILMLAIDNASGNVYFSLFNSHEITVCNSLGKNCAVVANNSSLVTAPIGLAVDSKNSFMYWGARRHEPHSLVRANLDGSNATIISAEFRNLYGITLQQSENGILYWADSWENAIGTIDVNGDNKRTLVKLEDRPQPYGIQVCGSKIYFSNYRSRNIQSVDRYSGQELTTIFNSSGVVRHIALFNPPVGKS